MKIEKTIVEKFLDKKKIPHESFSFPADTFSSGVEVAKYIGKPVEQVYKTLVCNGTNGIHVFVIPVAEELDLKKAAKVSGQKKVEMLPQKLLLETTGYIHGGCSPIGMKKLFPTYVDVSRKNFESIVFSAGKIGKQVQVGVSDLISLTKAKLEPVCKEEIC